MTAPDDAGTVAAPRDRSRRKRAATGAEPTGRRQILDGAIACILELGFYRASSNEIARRANVSWGSIQYHFGSREALLLAVIDELNRRFTTTVEQARISGETLEERLRSLYDILAKQYGDPIYLARLQIVLNLLHDPDTSADVTASLNQQAGGSGEDLRRLLRETLGEHVGTPTMNAVFNAIRGAALSRQISDALPMRRSTPRTAATDREELSILLAGMAAAARLDAGVTG
ncbi:MAG: regulatory protein TetR [Actinomycetia bacterium]|nr:regulatory protein TetR [Actinomycetes bacterium]